MRAILSISMPETKKKEVEARAAKLGLGVSKYILHCVELEKDVISEDELVRDSKKAMADYKAGKLEKVKSLKDLI